MKKKKRNNIKYSKIFIIVALFLFALIIKRIFELSLSKEIDGVNLQKLASSRTTKTEINEAKRGSIYTSNGEVLAQNVSSYKLIAYLDKKRTTDEKNPKHVIDKEETAKLLSPILEAEYEEILKYLSKENVYQTEFGIHGKGLNEIKKKQIDDLNLPGLDFIESFKRYYPKGDFASYIVGYAKVSNKDEANKTITGEMGIEESYDKTLKGENGSITYQKDLKGYRIADSKISEKETIEGKDIYLTINDNIQFFIEQAIKNTNNEYDWEWITISIMDAKTGAILGSSTHPSFDPNKRNITNYMNMLTSAYEPGSTMKTFTYMAAMENGVYDGSETYKSGVYKTKDGTEIGDWDRNGWGVINFDKGYALSSNVGVINLINKHMNSTMLREYFKRLGFGKKTGIALPKESKGYLGFKYETEIYNAGFGQGITTTPIQNLQAMTPLTNDGMLLKPYLVEKIVDSKTNEVIVKNKKDEIDRLASSKTVSKMYELMDSCVNGEGNTGNGFKIDSGELIGKTGTAQISEGRGYLSGKEDIISSFSGIYPKSDPKIIIYASVKRPSGGSQKAVSNTVKEIIYNISKFYAPKEENNTNNYKEYKVPSFINNSIDYAKSVLDKENIKYKVLGDGNKVIKQTPIKDDIITSDTIYLITSSKLTVPNLTNLSSKEAKMLLEELNIKVNLDGVGYVKSQSVGEGVEITPGMEITLVLEPKYKLDEE